MSTTGPDPPMPTAHVDSGATSSQTTTAVSISTLAAVIIGGVAGSLLIFALAFILLLLALLWMIRKNKLKRAAAPNKTQFNQKSQPVEERSRELQRNEPQDGDEDIVMNVAYISSAYQILTTDNVAYDQASPYGLVPTVDNEGYEKII